MIKHINQINNKKVLDFSLDNSVILKVKNLAVSFKTDYGRLRAVDDISFDVKSGKTLGIVGESGCGKTVTSFSIMRLLPKPSGVIEKGQVLYDNMDLLSIDIKKMHKIRGNKISMVFQEPMTALNPVYKIGRQVKEVLKIHYPDMSRAVVYKKSVEIFEKVGLPEPRAQLEKYPHQLSGGMRQRVMIAIALLCRPDILIADEPTTALDVTIQAQILELMKSLQKETGMAIIFITHDLGVIAKMSHDVVVIYAGKVVETAPVKTLFENPLHPYTQGLIASIPRLENVRKTRLATIPGMVPALSDMPSGCRFQNRCIYADDICKKVQPEMVHVGHMHHVCCHRQAVTDKQT